MKHKVTYVYGCAPNLPYYRCMAMTDEEIHAYNEQFYHRETVEFEVSDDEANQIFG